MTISPLRAPNMDRHSYVNVIYDANNLCCVVDYRFCNKKSVGGVSEW